MVQVVTSTRGMVPLALPEGERVIEMISLSGYVIASTTSGLWIKPPEEGWQSLKFLNDLQKELQERERGAAPAPRKPGISRPAS